ncbi:hypothetical protein DICPUDRAFT_94109 [Dictyostelium purpureum]|uniref:RBR-type E3 ubiquitin transferase n=1 Tax=Dictyostelium purpureum TaxID=5786 RepID=F0ZFH5_DICPU|nr:uncharacterized protein DICPUDRAFT_94109 [Dictyostelium purpureum]EGC37299.1 hypothetical protein DICPUDRAFT_94109 [Dictyostelium purpureum]|eukprot:XP_003286187.1 hypothetical protein DICPUDRAFT_94109 [Dictyostelium purpureum]
MDSSGDTIETYKPQGFHTPSPMRKSQRRGSFSSILRRSSIVSTNRRSSRDLTGETDEKMLKYLSSISFRKDLEMSDDASSYMSETASDIDIGDYDPSDWFLEEDQEDEEEPLFTILEKKGLEDQIKEMANTLSDQIDLKPGNAILLLQYFKWDVDRILSEYFEDPESYCSKAGIINPSNASNYDNTSISHFPQNSVCIICFEQSNGDFYSLPCGHGPYCLGCWKTYLHQEMQSCGSEIIHSKCIYPLCNGKLTYENWKDLASERDYNRYWYFVTKDFVSNDKHLEFCPNPTCGNAIKFSGVGRPSDVVECHCGTRFCFSCGSEKHNPVSCAQLKEWKSKNSNDQESLKLIKATCKPCYHCGMPTERIQGCNHMVCRKEQGGCGGEWCWMCRGPWKTHGQHTGGFYSCNKYEQSDGKKADESSAMVKQESDRFLHYFTRYFNHDMLMKHAIKMREEEMEDKMNQFRELTNLNPDFLQEAIELLIECRRILKYTYVFGYYLSDNVPGKTFFEYQQANAEGITELLSESVYINVALINAEDMKNRVRVTKKYITNLVKSIEEGLGLDGLGLSSQISGDK